MGGGASSSAKQTGTTLAVAPAAAVAAKPATPVAPPENCVARRIGRPPLAHGTFLRFVTVNDVYKLDNYPRIASAVKEFKGLAAEDNAVVVSALPGDFLAPCTLTNLDGGVAMLQALNEVPIDIVMFGNHEFDLKALQLQTRIKEYNGKWLNSNVTDPQFVNKEGKPLPEYDVITVGSRKVAMGAFLLDDMNQFAPRDDLKIAPPNDAVLQTWENIKAAEGSIDAFLPMLHLNIREDRSFASVVAKHPEMSKVTPVLLAAHDHEVYIEQAGKSLIFKVGCDAENVGIVDLFWTADGKLKREVHMLEAEDFPQERTVQAFVDKELAGMKQVMEVPICQVPDLGKPLSTARVRFEPEAMVSFLLSTTKKSMSGVELMFIQGGNVRGMTPEYQPGPFTFGNLMDEFAFETEIATVQLPGKIIAETIQRSRTSSDGAKPFFLHADLEAVFGEGHVLEQINGEPFDPKRIYTVATYQFLLNGMGNLEPMASYCKENGTCPSLEQCVPVKKYFMKTCTKAIWRELVGCSGEAEEMKQQLIAAFDKIDSNKNGTLEESEILAYVTASAKASPKIVKFLIQSFDTVGDEVLTKEEFVAIAD